VHEDYAEGAQLSAENVRLKAQLEVIVRFSISFSDGRQSAFGQVQP
jgi:hypothetical protein